MKKLFLLFALICGINSFAQQQKNSISVSGIHTYQPNPVFTAKMNLTSANVSYNAPDITLAKIKKAYLENLTEKGVDIKKLKENELDFALRGYQKDGMTLEFTTASQAELVKFLSVQSMGVTKQDVRNTSSLSVDEFANLSKMAYEDAQVKAKAIAKSLGKKLGDVMYYSDTNRRDIIDYTYDSKSINSRDYHISVTFELID